MPCSLHSLQWVALPPSIPKRTHFPQEHLRCLTPTMPCSLHALQWVARSPGIPQEGIHFPHAHLRLLTSTMPCSLHSAQWVARPPGIPKEAYFLHEHLPFLMSTLHSFQRVALPPGIMVVAIVGITTLQNLLVRTTLKPSMSLCSCTKGIKASQAR